MKKWSENFRLNEKMVFGIMGGVQTQRSLMRKTHTVLALSVALVLAGTVARAQNGERVEVVAGTTAPAWIESAGAFIEVNATLVQTAAGEASAFFRLLDTERPLIIAWHTATGFQLAAPGRLPQNIPENPTPGNPQTVALRLRIRSLKSPAQRLVLETRQPNGSWQLVFEKTMALNKTREWIEEGGVVKAGLAGPVELAGGMRVRVLREGTLLMIK